MKTTPQQLEISETHLTDGTALPELPDVCFSPSWLVDQDFGDQFWTSELETGETWHLNGETSLLGPS
jgi:hypothetical protein